MEEVRRKYLYFEQCLYYSKPRITLYHRLRVSEACYGSCEQERHRSDFTLVFAKFNFLASVVVQIQTNILFKNRLRSCLWLYADLCMLGNFEDFFCRLLIFFKINIF